MGSPLLVPLGLRLVSLFFPMKSSLVLKINNTWLILCSNYVLIDRIPFQITGYEQGFKG